MNKPTPDWFGVLIDTASPGQVVILRFQKVPGNAELSALKDFLLTAANETGLRFMLLGPGLMQLIIGVKPV